MSRAAPAHHVRCEAGPRPQGSEHHCEGSVEGAFSTRLLCGAAEAGGGGDPAALVVGREARAAVVADGPTRHAIGADARWADCRGARVGDGGNFVLGDAPIKGHGEAAEARDQRREGEQKEGTHLEAVET